MLVPELRGDMVIFINAKNTQTTAWRVLTEPTEHTCKALASVEAPTLRNTYDFPPIFPNLATIALLPLKAPRSRRGVPLAAPRASVPPLAALLPAHAGRGATHTTLAR